MSSHLPPCNESALPPMPHHSWVEHIPELRSDILNRVLGFVAERRQNATVYPAHANVFRALRLTTFENVRVVILGQDPYHRPGQANGLCFSVPETVAVPPSLRNIFKELDSDCGTVPGRSTDLTRWAEQGVLLLNTTLTVEEGKPGSHGGHGWEILTDAIVRDLSAKRSGLVFLLWGAPAQRKNQHIDAARHLVLAAPHPSPLSAYRGFFGCRHFSQTNAWLLRNRQSAITW